MHLPAIVRDLYTVAKYVHKRLNAWRGQREIAMIRGPSTVVEHHCTADLQQWERQNRVLQGGRRVVLAVDVDQVEHRLPANATATATEHQFKIVHTRTTCQWYKQLEVRVVLLVLSMILQ